MGDDYTAEEWADAYGDEWNATRADIDADLTGTFAEIAREQAQRADSLMEAAREADQIADSREALLPPYPELGEDEDEDAYLDGMRAIDQRRAEGMADAKRWRAAARAAEAAALLWRAASMENW